MTETVAFGAQVGGCCCHFSLGPQACTVLLTSNRWAKVKTERPAVVNVVYVVAALLLHAVT